MTWSSHSESDHHFGALGASRGFQDVGLWGVYPDLLLVFYCNFSSRLSVTISRQWRFFFKLYFAVMHGLKIGFQAATIPFLLSSRPDPERHILARFELSTMKIGAAVRAVREPKEKMLKNENSTATFHFTLARGRNLWGWHDKTLLTCWTFGRNQLGPPKSPYDD